MQLNTTKEIWDNVILSYEGDDQVKHAKLQSLIMQYETLKMHNNESVANYFLHIDEIVNHMKNLAEEIKEVTLVEKVLRSLSSKFESKVSAIEEKQNLQSITMSQPHRILTALEMRKGGPSDMREVAFKASGKGEYNESGHMQKERKNKTLSRTFKKVMEDLEVSYISNALLVEELVTMQPNVLIKISLIKVRNQLNGIENRTLLIAFEDDFLGAINEDDLYEKNSKLKIYLEEKSMIIDKLTFQLAEMEKHNEKLECEIVGLGKDIEKTKALNLRFSKGSETLDEIIKVQCSPLIKTGLEYTEEESQAQEPSTSKSYLDAARRSEQVENRQQRHKVDH
eukprot:PITA_12117